MSSENKRDNHRAIGLLEEAIYAFMCKTKELEPELPRSMQDCVIAARWALRMTVGEELKKHGVQLRYPQ
jgi:hypothetical protein